MNQKIIIAVIVILLLAVGGWFLINAMNAPADQTNQQTNTNGQQQNPVVDVEVGVNPPVPASHEVIYTDAGYAPTTLTIKTGDTVVFKNQSSGGMWTGSAMHPTHTAYSGTNVQQHCPDLENDDFDECKSDQPGNSWSFTFKKAGEWGYHNHVKSNHFGKIIVQ